MSECFLGQKMAVKSVAEMAAWWVELTDRSTVAMMVVMRVELMALKTGAN